MDAVTTLTFDGPAIKIRRQQLGLSRTQLAIDVNSSYAHIWNIENERFAPSVELGYRIAKRLGCDISEITKDTP